MEQKNKELISISEEYTALKSLIYILEVKHGKNIVFDVNESGFKQNKIATFTLQMLVENALKHNTVGQTNKLIIRIGIQENYLVESNNITGQKPVAYSSGIGLNNINERYKLLVGKEIIIDENENNFTVKIPLAQ